MRSEISKSSESSKISEISKSSKTKYFIIALLFAMIALTSVGVSKWNIHIQQQFNNPFSYVTEPTTPIISRYVRIQHTNDDGTVESFLPDKALTDDKALTYNQKPFEVVVTDDANGTGTDACDWSKWADKGLTFNYFYTGKTYGVSGTTTDGKTYSSSDAPKNAGEYTCTVTAEGSNDEAQNIANRLNVYGNTDKYAATVQFTINPKPGHIEGSVTSADKNTQTANLNAVMGQDKSLSMLSTAPFASGTATALNATALNATGLNANALSANAVTLAAEEGTNTEYFLPAIADNNVFVKAEDSQNLPYYEAKYNGQTKQITLEAEFVNGVVIGNDSVDITFDFNIDDLTNVKTDKIYTATAKSSNPNYAIINFTFRFKIIQREITVTIADKESVYGDNIASLTCTADNLAQGDQISDIVTLSTTAAKTSSVGDYYITGEANGSLANNYAVTFKNVSSTAANGTYTIKERPITVTIANKESVYGDNIVPLTCDNGVKTGTTESGVVNDDNIYDIVTLSTTAANTSNAGTYPITGEANGSLANNYAVTFKNGTYTISQREVTLTWSDTTLTYTGKAQKPTATAGNLVNNDSVTVDVTTTPTEAINVGNYTATATELSNTNYTLEGLTQNVLTTSFSITEKPVTLTWSNANNRTYNGESALPTATYTDANGDPQEATVTVTIDNQTVTEVKNAGTYTAKAAISDANYQIDGSATKTFTISQAPLTVKADNKEFSEGNMPENFKFTYSVTSGTIYSDDTITVNYKVTNKAGEVVTVNNNTPAGTYTITPSATHANYDITCEIGKLTVNKGITKPTPNTTVFTYNGSAQTYKPVNFNPDTMNITGNVQINAGTYEVIVTLKDTSATWSGGGNALLTFTFTIKPKPVTINWGDTTFTYNGAEQKPTATVSNLCQGDTCTVTVEGAATNAGTHTAIASQLDNDNYTLTGGSNLTTNFTIEKANLDKPQQNAGYPFTYDGKEKTYLTGIDLNTMTFTGNNKATNAGDYTANVSIKDKTNYKWTDGTDTDLTFNWSISSRVISFNGIIERNYNANGITLNADLLAGKIDNLVPGASIADILTINYAKNNDALTVATNDENNGKFYYVSGSTIKAGSTYEIKVTLKKNATGHYNYVFGENSATGITHLKYQTAKVGETYYTIEDALDKGGDITLASNSTGNDTYVITAFSKLGYYNSENSYTNSSKIILPYTSGVTASLTQQTGNSDKKVGSVLILQEGVTLTTTGAIDITAIISHNGSNTGVTATHAVLMNHGTLNVNKTTLTAYGYLKGTGTVELLNGSTATDIFRIYDFKGGGNTLGIVGCDHVLLTVDKHNYFPINSYSIHNISCKTKINSGCFYNAQYEITMGGKWFSDPVKIVGNTTSGTLFKLSSGYIEKSAAPAASWKDTGTNSNYNALNTITGDNQIMGQKERINIYGTTEDGRVKIEVSLDIKIGTVTLPMETNNDNPLPIPYIDITVGRKESNVGNLTLSNSSYKFMPGSSLTVEDGASLTVGQNTQIVLYSVDDCTVLEKPANYYAKDATTPSAYPYDYITKYCIDKSNSWLNIGGTVNIYGRISGEIKTNNSNATLTLTNTNTDITVLKDFHAQAKSLLTFEYATVTDRQSSTVRAMRANGLIWMSANTPTTNDNFSAGTYKSDGAHWYKTGNYNITYDTQGGTLPENYKQTAVCGEEIGALPTPTKLGYQFNGWTYNNGTQVSEGVVFYTDINFTATWTANTYTVYMNNDYGETTTATFTGNTTFTLPQLDSVTDNGQTLSFAGWYKDPTFAGASVTSVNANDADNNLHINVYAKFTAAELYSVTYVMNKDNLPFTTTINNVTEQDEDYTTLSLLDMTSYNTNPEFNYKFIGWYNESGEQVTQIDGTVNKLTLYAHWAAKQKVTITNKATYKVTTSLTQVDTLSLNAGASKTLYYYNDTQLALGAITTTPAKKINTDGNTAYIYKPSWKTGNSVTITAETALEIVGTNDETYYKVTVTIEKGTSGDDCSVKLTIPENCGYETNFETKVTTKTLNNDDTWYCFVKAGTTVSAQTTNCQSGNDPFTVNKAMTQSYKGKDGSSGGCGGGGIKETSNTPPAMMPIFTTFIATLLGGYILVSKKKRKNNKAI